MHPRAEANFRVAGYARAIVDNDHISESVGVDSRPGICETIAGLVLDRIVETENSVPLAGVASLRQGWKRREIKAYQPVRGDDATGLPQSVPSLKENESTLLRQLARSGSVAMLVVRIN